MAHAAVVTVKDLGGGDWSVVIDETDVAAASSVALTCGPTPQAGVSGVLPAKGRVRRVRAAKASGDAATLATKITPEDTTWTELQATAAASVDEVPVVPIPYYGPVLTHRSVPNTGTNNVVRTEYLISEGW